MNDRILRLAATAVPAGILGGWILMRVSGHNGPGGGWTLAHLVWLASYALCVPLIVALGRPLSRWPTSVIATVTLTGNVAVLGQMVIDLVVGLRSADRAELTMRFEEAYRVPGVQLVCYQVGPVLFLVGMLALLVYPAVRRKVRASTSVVGAIGLTLMAAEQSAGAWRLLVMPLGLCAFWFALTRTARRCSQAT